MKVFSAHKQNTFLQFAVSGEVLRSMII